MLYFILTLISAITAFIYLRMVRQDSYERGYMMGHAEAVSKVHAAMNRCEPPF